jgi:ATP-dependent Lhr-like helicase
MCSQGEKIVSEWFASRGWQMASFQSEMMQRYLEGFSGILNAPTGSGKTYAMFMPMIADHFNKARAHDKKSRGLKILWITPLKALTADIHRALQEACDETGIGWRVGSRTGDTSVRERKLQKKEMPDVLLITPESLHLLFTQRDHHILFRDLDAVVVDEWHELMGNKRGVQAELALSGLRSFNRDLRIWGISATIGNLEEALMVVAGLPIEGRQLTIVKADDEKHIEIRSLMPERIETLPWAGHIGVRLLDEVIPVIDSSRSTLIFTNTRSQAEIWYRNIIEAYPHLSGLIAMHHGSLDKKVRTWVEEALHQGALKAVVCTSSLDLGVDFRPVETIIQVGSPKSIARFIQRAGRSGHNPGATSRIYFLPTNSLELIECSALRSALDDGATESRVPFVNSFDVLLQYMVTRAIGGGFRPEELYRELCSTYSYQELTYEEWGWLIDFITTGGQTLHAYDEFHKAVIEDHRVVVNDRGVTNRHKMNIGTIVSEAMVNVRMNNGRSLGSVEEYFISHLKPGDVFWFSGRSLELVHFRGMTATVQPSGRSIGVVPRWMGGRMSLSSNFSSYLRSELDKVSKDRYETPELERLRPLLKLQSERSAIPSEEQLLVEQIRTDEGTHILVYPFEGRQVHEGLSALLAWRISRFMPITFSIAMNDHGFELLTDRDIDISELLKKNDLFSPHNLVEDIQRSLNATEMARRKFREIGAISGMIFKGYPGKAVKTRHLQMSSGLIFDVLREHEPDGMLIRQCYEEVFDQQLEEHRLREALVRIRGQEIVVTNPRLPTPFAFPIMVDRLREQLTNESLTERIQKMAAI